MPQPQSDEHQKKEAVWYFSIMLWIERLRRKSLNKLPIAVVPPMEAAPENHAPPPNLTSSVTHTPPSDDHSLQANSQGSQVTSNDKSSKKTEALTLAEQIHKEGQAYAAYSVLDSLSSSYSMFKYFFDVTIGGTQDDMHHAMLTPEGIAAISAEALFLVGFSFLAYCFDKENKKTESERNAIKIQLNNAWPYFRDVMKGLKNAYKGFRSAIMALHLLGVSGTNLLILPLGLTLGILAASNRFLMRRITEARKSMMDANGDFLKALIGNPLLIKKDVGCELSKIKMQTSFERRMGYVYSALGGSIDGLYLYAGALTLTVLAPYLLIPMLALSAFYTLSCIITRLYEEYDFQLRLEVTQTKCRLAIYTRRIQTIFSELKALERSDMPYSNTIRLKQELATTIAQLEIERDLLKKQTSSSAFISVLLGVKNGLYAYGALSSIVFLAATILSFSGVAFPPVLIVIFISTGALFMLGFLIHALVVNHKHSQSKISDEDTHAFSQLIDMKNELTVEYKNASTSEERSEPDSPTSSSFSDNSDVQAGEIDSSSMLDSEEEVTLAVGKQKTSATARLGFFPTSRPSEISIDSASNQKIKTQAELDKSLHAALSVTPCPSYKFQEWFEVIRSLFSGLSKGQKFIDFSCNPLQEVGRSGHYQDTPVMFVLGGLSALLFGITFACRALARGMGRSTKEAALVEAATSYASLNQEQQDESKSALEAKEGHPPRSLPRSNSAPVIISPFLTSPSRYPSAPNLSGMPDLVLDVERSSSPCSLS